MEAAYLRRVKYEARVQAETIMEMLAGKPSGQTVKVAPDKDDSIEDFLLTGGEVK